MLLPTAPQGAKVPLQRISLEVPPAAGIGGVTFVLRSADATRWYRDADRNFFVPLPTKGEEVQKADMMERCGRPPGVVSPKGLVHDALHCALWAVPPHLAHQPD